MKSVSLPPQQDDEPQRIKYLQSLLNKTQKERDKLSAALMQIATKCRYLNGAGATCTCHHIARQVLARKD